MIVLEILEHLEPMYAYSSEAGCAHESVLASSSADCQLVMSIYCEWAVSSSRYICTCTYSGTIIQCQAALPISGAFIHDGYIAQPQVDTYSHTACMAYCHCQ